MTCWKFIFAIILTVVATRSDAATVLRPPSKSECKKFASNNACTTHGEFMSTYCDKFLVCHPQGKNKRFEEPIKSKQRSKVQVKKVKSFFDLEAKSLEGGVVKFDQFRGKVTVVVNVASECGYTEDHYSGMIRMFNGITDARPGQFNILAFPCNQFGKQEPGSPSEIKKFTDNLGVKFMVMKKVKVNGPDAHPVYQFLKEQEGPKAIKWNFETYYVIDPKGNVSSYSGIEPRDVAKVVAELLDLEVAFDDEDDEDDEDEDWDEDDDEYDEEE